MKQDYSKNYEQLLRKTLRGTRIRSFFCLGDSAREYLRHQKDRIMELKIEAEARNVNLGTSKTFRLEYEVFSLGARFMSEDLGLAY